jgi:hypothetical protein
MDATGVPSHASARATSVTAAAVGIGTAHGNRARHISSRHSNIEIKASIEPSGHPPSMNGFGNVSVGGASVTSS